jgi:hydroxyacylglutathione hydrolase
MERKRVRGNTYVIEARSELIPYYQVGERDIVLLDSGYETPDREALKALLDREGLRVAAVIGTHIHTDHSGNHSYFQSKGAEIILPFIEAAVGQSPLTGKLAFFLCSPGQVETLFGSMLVKADRVIMPGEEEVSVCGAVFRIVSLPGHTTGHIGIITPDHVFYVGDALMSEDILNNAKLPTSLSYAADLESKRKLYDHSYDAYIVAHKGIYKDITRLIARNIQHREERVQAVAGCLQEPMTLDELSHVVWQAFSVRTRQPGRIAVYLRNLHSILEYLCDRGDVERQFAEGITRYVQKKASLHPAVHQG